MGYPCSDFFFFWRDNYNMLLPRSSNPFSPSVNFGGLRINPPQYRFMKFMRYFIDRV